MKGEHKIVVRSSRVQFKLSVRRNLTVLRGDSATGKSILIGMISDYEQLGGESGVSLTCDVPCAVVSGRRWQRDLASIDDSIVFIDEGNDFVYSTDFARVAKNSGNYYVIAAREGLPALPYSVDEIYGLRNSGRITSKYPAITRVYAQTHRIYNDDIASGGRPELVVVEDSNAGFEFFAALCEREGVPCVSAAGKSRVFDVVKNADAHRILVIADGAAFGPEIERVCSLRYMKDVRLYLPESFEWLVLKSGLFDGGSLTRVLNDPPAYIESREYFSWERFFTDKLTEVSSGTYLAYSKGSLNPSFLLEKEASAIEGQLPELGIS